MDIILYNNTDDNRKLNKSPTAIKTIPVRLKDDTDIMHPVIELDSVNLPPTANYCYIAAFNRYYYINQQGIKIGRDLTLTLSVDVLMSFRDVINNSVVVAWRSGTNYNKMLPDTIPIQANRNVLYRKFTGGNAGFGSDKVTSASKCYCLSVLNGNIKLSPPSGLEIISVGLMIAVKWDEVTGASDYSVVYRLVGVENWTHYESEKTISRSAIFTVDSAGNYEIGVAAKDMLGGIIGKYKYGTITVTGE